MSFLFCFGTFNLDSVVVFDFHFTWGRVGLQTKRKRTKLRG